MQLPEPQRRPAEDNILPLINIIFLLLIFFMLAGRITTPGALVAEPPEARTGRELNEEARLTIAADGRLAWDGELVLPEALNARLANVTGDALIVRADGDVASRDLMPVLRRLRRAGIEDVTLITQRNE